MTERDQFEIFLVRHQRAAFFYRFVAAYKQVTTNGACTWRFFQFNDVCYELPDLRFDLGLHIFRLKNEKNTTSHLSAFPRFLSGRSCNPARHIGISVGNPHL